MPRHERSTAIREDLQALATVVTKRPGGGTFDNDTAVDTKSADVDPFGNYNVVTKVCAGDPVVGPAEITNTATAVGFIRVRKRALKGGHPMWRLRAKASMSFDLVRAIRLHGKPRHQFVLGLGSQQSAPRYPNDIADFWEKAIRRMTRHGIGAPQRQRLIAAMVRKGARLPTPDECERHIANQRAIAERYGWKLPDSSVLTELIAYIGTLPLPSAVV